MKIYTVMVDGPNIAPYIDGVLEDRDDAIVRMTKIADSYHIKDLTIEVFGLQLKNLS